MNKKIADETVNKSEVVSRKAPIVGKIKAGRRGRKGRKTKKGAITAQSAVNLATQLKLAAMRGLTVAQAELELATQLSVISYQRVSAKSSPSTHSASSGQAGSGQAFSLNQLFEKKPDLKIAWERGRFLGNLAACSAKGTTVSDAEHDLNMPVGELEKILASDFEAADVWNQSLAKALNFLRGKMLEKVEEASVPALKMMYQMLRRQIITGEIDITHISGPLMEKITGKTRQTLYIWVTEKGCPKNADSSFNLKDFLNWFERFAAEKASPGKPAEQNSLQTVKAKQLQLELEEKAGNLIPRSQVITGLIARHQTVMSLFAKYIGGETEPFVKQKLEKVFEDIRRELAGNVFDMKLDDKQQAILKELLDSHEDTKTQSEKIEVKN